MFRLAAALLALSMPAAAMAQTMEERLEALRAFDPELYATVMWTFERRSREIDGGFDWNYQAVGFECDPSYSGDGLSGCRLQIDLSAESYAGGEDRRTAELKFDCEAEITLWDMEGESIMSDGQERSDIDFSSAGRRSTTLWIEFYFMSQTRDFVEAEVERVDCELTGID